jgi:hypothetical protein
LPNPDYYYYKGYRYTFQLFLTKRRGELRQNVFSISLRNDHHNLSFQSKFTLEKENQVRDLLFLPFFSLVKASL